MFHVFSSGWFLWDIFQSSGLPLRGGTRIAVATAASSAATAAGMAPATQGMAPGSCAPDKRLQFSCATWTASSEGRNLLGRRQQSGCLRGVEIEDWGSRDGESWEVLAQRSRLQRSMWLRGARRAKRLCENRWEVVQGNLKNHEGRLTWNGSHKKLSKRCQNSTWWAAGSPWELADGEMLRTGVCPRVPPLLSGFTV